MQMFERSISIEAVKTVVVKGEIIQSYSDDKPYPSFLILGYIESRPLHVVVANDKTTNECVIITAYQPSEKVWIDDFKTRIKN